MNSRKPSRYRVQPSNRRQKYSKYNLLRCGYVAEAGKIYPLKHIWTLWYFCYDGRLTWEDMQTEVASIDILEDFCHLNNCVKPASKLKIGCDYSLFKANIKPLWEDPANMNGGRWLITFSRNYHKRIDALWIELALLLIGDAFRYSDQITGAVINVRFRNYKISVWISDGNDYAAITEIHKMLCDKLQLKPCMFKYELHADAMKRSVLY